MDNNNIPNNHEGIAFLGMAYACASLPGSSIKMPDGCPDELVVTAIFPRLHAGEVAEAGTSVIADEENSLDHINYYSVGDNIRGDLHLNGRYPSYIIGRKSPEELGDYDIKNADNIPDPDAKNLLLSIAGSISDWMQWFIDLINAFQTGGLSSGNVSSYFAWNGVVGVEGNFISDNMCRLSGNVARIARDEGTRALLREGKWTEYRLNFATVVGQLIKMVDELPREDLKMFTNDTIERIRIANRDNWSEEAFRAIGTKPLAVLQAWLIVSNSEISNLWSAKRAYDELNVTEKESLKNWFKRVHSKIKAYKGGLTSSFKDMPESLKNI